VCQHYNILFTSIVTNIYNPSPDNTNLHYDKEQRDVGAFPRTVSVEVHPRAHLVTVATGEERLTVERHVAARRSLESPARVVANLPDHTAVVVGRLDALEAEVHLRQAYVVQAQSLVVLDELRLETRCRGKYTNIYI